MILQTVMRPDHGKVGLVDMCNDIKKHLNDSEITIVEIGSYMGESAEVFAQEFPRATIYCVDPWLGGFDDLDTASRADFSTVEEQFDLRTKKYPNIIKVKNFSKDVVIKTDVVYIDGCHKYECVIEDIKHWLPQTKSIVTGHDYYEDDNFLKIHPHVAGVKKAVNELLGTPDSLYSDGSWLKKIK